MDCLRVREPERGTSILLIFDPTLIALVCQSMGVGRGKFKHPIPTTAWIIIGHVLHSQYSVLNPCAGRRGV